MRHDFTQIVKSLLARKKNGAPGGAPKKDRLKIPVLGESQCVSAKVPSACRTTSDAWAFLSDTRDRNEE
jgi:hypothetical protein